MNLKLLLYLIFKIDICQLENDKQINQILQKINPNTLRNLKINAKNINYMKINKINTMLLFYHNLNYLKINLSDGDNIKT